MKKFRLFLGFLLIAFGLTSCGFTMMPLSSTPTESQFRVNVDKQNFKIVKMVEGEASATYVFGIGGLSKKALTGNAVADMYKKADLKGAQQVIDITTSESVANYVVVVKKTVIARGFVVEYE